MKYAYKICFLLLLTTTLFVACDTDLDDPTIDNLTDIELRDECNTTLDITNFGNDGAAYNDAILDATSQYLACNYPVVFGTGSGECGEYISSDVKLVGLCTQNNFGACTPENPEDSHSGYVNPPSFNVEEYVDSAISRFYNQFNDCGPGCSPVIQSITVYQGDFLLCPCGGADSAEYPCEELWYFAHHNAGLWLSFTYECCCLQPGPDSEGPISSDR